MSVSFKDEVDLFDPAGWEDFAFDTALALPDDDNTQDANMPAWPLDSRSASLPHDHPSWSAWEVSPHHSPSAVSSSTGPIPDQAIPQHVDYNLLTTFPTRDTTINQSDSCSIATIEPPREPPAALSLARSNSAPAMKTRRPHKRFKKYSAMNPSRYCHICAKKRDEEPSLICHNVSNLLCQKRVCKKCFTKRSWDWESASAPGSNWLCPHCRDECPKEGRCFVYGRGNRREEAHSRDPKPNCTASVHTERVTPESSKPNKFQPPEAVDPFTLPLSTSPAATSLPFLSGPFPPLKAAPAKKDSAQQF